jgi:hypothetical protein
MRARAIHARENGLGLLMTRKALACRVTEGREP